MGLNIPLIFVRFARISAATIALGLLVACAGSSSPQEINDPFEPTNRSIHAFNRGVDRVLVGPASRGYGKIIPEPVVRVVGNVADTLNLPGDIANNLLQARVDKAGLNSLRLAVNLTMGVLGLFDAATALGLPEAETDFGETLHVWGVGEGPYLELPLAGPSTLRDAAGTVVDLAFNPVQIALPRREATAATVLMLLSRLGDRDRFSETVNSILYDSADSYAQARLLYLQNRRFKLGQGKAGADGSTTNDDDFIDPYEDADAE